MLSKIVFVLRVNVSQFLLNHKALPCDLTPKAQKLRLETTSVIVVDEGKPNTYTAVSREWSGTKIIQKNFGIKACKTA